ncbi:MAG: DUF433 domain-containing protein [Candidatus Hodarchaeota archaeon]
MTIQEIREEFPYLEEEDFKACIAFARRIIEGKAISSFFNP